jgi:hypothetical protein
MNDPVYIEAAKALANRMQAKRARKSQHNAAGCSTQ